MEAKQEYEVRFRVRGTTLAGESKPLKKSIEDLVWETFDSRFAPDPSGLDCKVIGGVDVIEIK